MVTNCFFVDQQGTITTQLNTYEQKYTAFAAAQKGVTSAQDAYTKAQAAEAGAKDAYDQLAAVNTTLTPPGGGTLVPWVGAEAALQAADAKGGIR